MMSNTIISWFKITPGFRSVSFTLHTKDMVSTVMNVLTSCSLSVKHMEDLKTSKETAKRPAEAGIPFYRPIKWDKTYYTFTGYRDPEQELEQAKRVEPTLRLVCCSSGGNSTLFLYLSESTYTPI